MLVTELYINRMEKINKIMLDKGNYFSYNSGVQ